MFPARRWLGALGLAWSVALAGCAGEGRSEPEPDPSVLRDALAVLFAGDHPTDRSDDEGRCFAEALLARVEPEELRAAGVLDASYAVADDLPALPGSLAGHWVDAQLVCTDFVASAAAAAFGVSHGNLDLQAYEVCLRAALTAEQLRSGLMDTLTGDWDGPALARLGTAQAECATR